MRKTLCQYKNEKRYTNVAFVLQKIKDEVQFNLCTKKKQATLEAFFEKNEVVG